MKKHDRAMVWLVAAVGLVCGISGCGGNPAAVPTSYDTYKAKDGSFQIQYPANWEAKGGGVAGRAWAKFTSGNAEIAVEADAAGSVMADIAQPNRVAGQEKDPNREAVAVVHTGEKSAFEEQTGVQEQDPTIVKTGLTDGRRSEFTGARTFGAPIHGYRATVLSIDRRIRVVGQCSESQWESLKPAFEKVIASVSK